MPHRWTVPLPFLLAIAGLAASCAAQPREAEPDPELTEAFPELAEGEAVEIGMDTTVERSFTYGPVRITVELFVPVTRPSSVTLTTLVFVDR